MTIDDPTVLLRKEHTAILGLLTILEMKLGPPKILAALRALYRDSTIHFKRESAFFHRLETRLGKGKPTLSSLHHEHEKLKREVRELASTVSVRGSQPLPTIPADVRRRIRKLVEQFRTHIHHEETVVYLLAQTRLTARQRQEIAAEILMA